MKLLLDTCTFLWIILRSPKLSAAARDLFQAADNEVFLSAASSWEIALKHAGGQLPLPGQPAQFIPQQRRAHNIRSLPVTETVALHVARLPMLHSDPFDRLLVAQALVDGLIILTPDEAITQYPARVLW